jgi:hypothetical protein
MRYPFVDKTFPDIAFSLMFRWSKSGNFSLFFNALLRVYQQIVGVTGSHETGTSQRQGNPAGIDSYPSPPPLFGNIGSRSAAASRVEYQVTGVSGHEKAAFNNLLQRLNYINFL